jgi:hypothetical protein
MPGLIEAFGFIGGSALEGAGKGWLEELKANAIKEREESLIRLKAGYDKASQIEQNKFLSEESTKKITADRDLFNLEKGAANERAANRESFELGLSRNNNDFRAELETISHEKDIRLAELQNKLHLGGIAEQDRLALARIELEKGNAVALKAAADRSPGLALKAYNDSLVIFKGDKEKAMEFTSKILGIDAKEDKIIADTFARLYSDPEADKTPEGIKKMWEDARQAVGGKEKPKGNTFDTYFNVLKGKGLISNVARVDIMGESAARTSTEKPLSERQAEGLVAPMTFREENAAAIRKQKADREAAAEAERVRAAEEREAAINIRNRRR